MLKADWTRALLSRSSRSLNGSGKPGWLEGSRPGRESLLYGLRKELALASAALIDSNLWVSTILCISSPCLSAASLT